MLLKTLLSNPMKTTQVDLTIIVEIEPSETEH
jgi:hypothetical protein